jgi:hypothetical protein
LKIDYFLNEKKIKIMSEEEIFKQFEDLYYELINSEIYINDAFLDAFIELKKEIYLMKKNKKTEE